MTKEEMLEKYSPNSQVNNYNEAQKMIADAMIAGEQYVYLPGKNCRSEFNWCATKETIEQLKRDGFEIDKMWEPYEYWSVEWYEDK